MSARVGLDIGGTKIAGAVFDERGQKLIDASVPTPQTYDAFLESCAEVIHSLEEKTATGDFLGVSICGSFDRKSGVMSSCVNVPCLSEKPLRQDLEKATGKRVILENDANCAALAEALDGPGKGYDNVFALILGTGVGGGFIHKGKIIAGANSLCGEIGHLPLPFYEETDGPRVKCGCGQFGCIETFISGNGLARLYQRQTDKEADARQIGALAAQGDSDAINVLDRYDTLVAKAMVTVLHAFDPDVIIVSGGLSALPGLYEAVSKRWGQYALCKHPVTAFVPASFGSLAGLYGAARLCEYRCE